jgi:hypothetical protein
MSTMPTRTMVPPLASSRSLSLSHKGHPDRVPFVILMIGSSLRASDQSHRLFPAR